MSDYTVIADLGESLIRLLRNGMNDLVKAESIVLLSPADVDNQDIRLTLFLYSLTENSHLKNQPPLQNDPGRQLSPALHLDLHYLLTTYASEQIPDRTERSLEEQRLLGRAMLILHDQALLGGSFLQGGLAGSGEEFRISPQALTLEEQNRIWSVFPNRSFRASVSYLLSSVSLDSTRSSDSQRVLVRDL